MFAPNPISAAPNPISAAPSLKEGNMVLCMKLYILKIADCRNDTRKKKTVEMTEN
jgi:hypothetical protein